MIIIAGIVNATGEPWVEQRKFAHTVLREYGMGKNIIEVKIKEEVSLFLSRIQDTQPMQFDPIDYIEKAVANITCSMLFGERYEYSSPRFHTYLSTLNANMRLIGTAGILNIFPALKYLPGDLFSYKKLHRGVEKIYGMLSEEIKTHKENVTHSESPDFIDAYLQKISQISHKESSTFHGIYWLITY